MTLDEIDIPNTHAVARWQGAVMNGVASLRQSWLLGALERSISDSALCVKT